MRVELDARSLSIDGERKLVRAAELPYFRLPSQDLWRDRIEKIRDCGLDAVDVRYPWAYHAERPGEFEFTGIRDVERLHDLIEEAGLYLIARPGPFVRGDLDLGGLPAWLLRQPDVTLRCRTRDGFSFSPEFVEASKAWFSAVVPRFAARDNLLLVGLEDGFTLGTPYSGIGTDLLDLALRWFGSRFMARVAGRVWGLRRPRAGGRGDERARGRGQTNPYMRALRASLREHGVSVPVFHGDLSAWTGRQMDVDLPALARPSRVERDEDARGLAAHRSDVPLFYTGLPAGESEGWGGAGYEDLGQRRGPEAAVDETWNALAAGASAWSYASFCGGISWGYMASPNVYSSWDCAAPIGESGNLRPAYVALQRLNTFLDRFEGDLAGASARAPDGIGPVAMREADRLRFEFWRNSTSAPREVPGSTPGRGALAPGEHRIRVIGDDGSLEAESPEPLALSSAWEPESEPPLLPRLERWTFSGASPQLEPGYDDSAWDRIPSEQVDHNRIDLDSLGVHHGFVWYRGTYHGPLDRLLLDARHCYAVWINHELVAAGDQLKNRLGIGPDGARVVRVPLQRASNEIEGERGRNVIVILVESLGHHQNLADDGRNPRGIVRIDTGSTQVDWRYRGGIVRGEHGLAPLVAFEAVEHTGVQEVVLPHGWTGEPHGVGLYETHFQLEGVDPKAVDLGLRFDPGRGKANLYLNGYLLGRYWPERGPQQRFLLPWGVLHPVDENHLAIALWRRTERGALGKVRLERM